MNQTLATMLTMTTYGTWLRGDARGWVDRGIIWPENPQLERVDQGRLKHPPFRFKQGDLDHVGAAIGQALRERLEVRLAAMAVQTWHVHLVVMATRHPIGNVVKCAKDAARWVLLPGRPIWTRSYDKRFIFDEMSLRNRIDYVERHNVQMGLPARPWPFIESV